MQMHFDRNKQHTIPRIYLEPTAYQSHHTNGKQQMGINMSVFFIFLQKVVGTKPELT